MSAVPLQSCSTSRTLAMRHGITHPRQLVFSVKPRQLRKDAKACFGYALTTGRCPSVRSGTSDRHAASAVRSNIQRKSPPGQRRRPKNEQSAQGKPADKKRCPRKAKNAPPPE